MSELEHPINQLRATVEIIQRGQLLPPSLAAWLIAGAQRYEGAALAGDPMGLDVALGLGKPGRHGWWTAEARTRRNALLRELRARRFRDLDDCAASRAIAAALCSPRGDPILMAILATGCSRLGSKQVRRIIAGTNTTE